MNPALCLRAMSTSPKSHRKKLTEGPVIPHLVRLTGPMIVGMLSMVAFNFVDTYFVGKLGDQELAALTFTFPVIMVIFSLIQGIAIGATALISKSIGANNWEQAQRETTDALFLGVAVAGLFVVLGLWGMDPIFTLLGAKGHILELVKSYMNIWFVAIMFVVVPFIGNSAIRSVGDAKTPALIMLFAVIINAVLDPLFIFGFGSIPAMGLEGAALATAISRGSTFVLSIYILARREKLLTFHFPGWKVLRGCWAAILSIGLPTGLSRALNPLAIFLITRLIAQYGEDAVAGYGVGTRIELLAMSFLFALAATIGPFTGQNFGGQQFDRIDKAIKVSSLFAVVWGITTGLAVWGFSQEIASIFSADAKVVENAALYLSFVPMAIGFNGLSQIINANLNTLKKPISASLLQLCIMFGFMVPLAYLGSHFFQIPGIFGGIAIAYVLGGFTSYAWNQRIFHKKFMPQQPETFV